MIHHLSDPLGGAIDEERKRVLEIMASILFARRLNTEDVHDSRPKSHGIEKGLPLPFDGMKPRGRLIKESEGENLV